MLTYADVCVQAVLRDVVPLLEAHRPGIRAVVADVGKMVGVQCAKMWMQYMTTFLASHAPVWR